MINLDEDKKCISPCEELRDYCNFIEEHLFSWCDFEVNEEDGRECIVRSYFFDFSFSLSIEDDMVNLCCVILDDRSIPYKAVTDLNRQIQFFNHKHIPIVSYQGDFKRKWFFSNPTYEMTCFFLTQKWHVETNPSDIAIFIESFYDGLFDLFTDQQLHLDLPRPNENNKRGDNFIEHLGILKAVFYSFFSNRADVLEREINGLI
jgi:hypothetical protein